MSSYLLDGSNTSFIANAIIDIARNPQVKEVVYPLVWRGIISSRIDYYTSKKELLKYKKDMYKKLRMLNYEALSERYKDEPPTAEQLEEGYIKQKNWMLYNDSVKMYYTLAGVISCYLYQCSEGDVCEKELFKALEEIERNLYKKICEMKLGDFDGWADVESLKENITERIEVSSM